MTIARKNRRKHESVCIIRILTEDKLIGLKWIRLISVPLTGFEKFIIILNQTDLDIKRLYKCYCDMNNIYIN